MKMRNKKMIASTLCGDFFSLAEQWKLPLFVPINELILFGRKYMLDEGFFFSLNVDSCKSVDRTRPERCPPRISEDFLVIIFHSDEMRWMMITQLIDIHTPTSVHKLYLVPLLVEKDDSDEFLGVCLIFHITPPYVLLFLSLFIFFFNYIIYFYLHIFIVLCYNKNNDF